MGGTDQDGTPATLDAAVIARLLEAVGRGWVPASLQDLVQAGCPIELMLADCEMSRGRTSPVLVQAVDPQRLDPPASPRLAEALRERRWRARRGGLAGRWAGGWWGPDDRQYLRPMSQWARPGPLLDSRTRNTAARVAHQGRFKWQKRPTSTGTRSSPIRGSSTAPPEAGVPDGADDLLGGLLLPAADRRGLLPGPYKIKVWGVVNFGLLFALSQFVVAWRIAFYYSRRAGAEFDRAAAEIAATYQSTGRS